MDKETLIQFSNNIAQLFSEGKIRAPVHLSGGNEDALIDFFKDVRPDDWVFSTHRSHYHALLKGIPADWLKAEILAGRSMHINSVEHKFMSSAIVGGCLPIALGVAMAIKRKGGSEKVWCFIGDMAAETGMKEECHKYVAQQGLPMNIVVENNGLSVDTPTQEIWGKRPSIMRHYRYQYERTWPHVGMGQWVEF